MLMQWNVNTWRHEDLGKERANVVDLAERHSLVDGQVDDVANQVLRLRSRRRRSGGGV